VSITERARIAGGTITIETEVNRGTRVHATIPVNGRGNIGVEASVDAQVA
jgi:hypothetical protein